MNNTPQTQDLSDPSHPLHRPAKPAAAAAAPTPAKPVKAKAVKAKAVKAKATKSAKPVKAKGKAKDEGKAKNPRSIVPVRFKQAYAAHNDTCGSRLALALKTATTKQNDDGRDALDVDALRAIAKANDVDFSKYEKLNNGQKRMNVGNKLAGLVKNGVTVIVGKQKFANESAVKHAA